MRVKQKKILDLVVIGSGLSSLNFIDTYLEKKKKIDVISPDFKDILKFKKEFKTEPLPSQMRGKNIFIENYFSSNQIKLEKKCNALGVLAQGGLSNYWGLQLDNYFFHDQKELKGKTFKIIEKEFVEFLKKFKIIGSFYSNKKLIYKNNLEIPAFLNKLIEIKDNFFKFEKPILGYFSKKRNIYFDQINESNDRLVPEIFLKKIGKRKKIVFHNYYVDEIMKNKNIVKLILKNENSSKTIYCKKIVFASGAIATTKILIDYLKIRGEIKIKHHPRLFGLFFSRKPINSKLKFTPSLIQVISKSIKKRFSADIRPGNKFITESLIEGFPFLYPIKFLINYFQSRLIFSNILLDSTNSNLFLKKQSNKFILFSKENDNSRKLKEQSKKIFKFLVSKKVIYPFYKTYYPGNGADYHYFGSIPFKKKGKLAVNNKCQLLSNKNIYIVDGSVFDFKTNKYPLGLVIANARRIGKLLSK
tara:strand:+ start:313 stop:1731 length:1419 start_codon:yes stop_codon:yes gene_type:complete